MPNTNTAAAHGLVNIQQIDFRERWRSTILPRYPFQPAHARAFFTGPWFDHHDRVGIEHLCNCLRSQRLLMLFYMDEHMEHARQGRVVPHGRK